MEELFRQVQQAVENSNDALFEVSRQRLPADLAQEVAETREQLSAARAALVRLEAEMLRCTRAHNWSHETHTESATHSTHS